MHSSTESAFAGRMICHGRNFAPCCPGFCRKRPLEKLWQSGQKKIQRCCKNSRRNKRESVTNGSRDGYGRSGKIPKPTRRTWRSFRHSAGRHSVTRDKYQQETEGGEYIGAGSRSNKSGVKCESVYV